MAEFLIEIYSEEIPAKMQNKAVENFEKIFTEFFVKQNIKFTANEIQTFISPNRLVFVAHNIDEFQITPSLRKNGPKLNADLKAIEGFIKSVGASSVNDLGKNETNYYFDQKEGKIAINEILAKNLPALLQKMSSAWPKTMKWQAGQTQVWVRPIRHILCLFAGNIVAFEFAGVRSSNQTNNLEIKNFSDYQKILKQKHIVLNSIDRSEIIINQINQICRQVNCKTIEDLSTSSLLQEVVGLASSPEALLGKIDSQFMELPEDVLILTIKLNQKSFCLLNEKGKLAPYFIFISNVPTTDQKTKDKIIADNEKVVRARLNDARFFIEEDLRRPLISRWDDLKHIIFHEKLGSVYHKTRRLEYLSEFISLWVPHSQIALADDLAKLTKCDLTTKAVGEFPELQGLMGAYYAKIQGYKPEVYEAIADHYLPLGPNSKLPRTPLAALLSIADKMDNICGLFLANQKPTSSKDPYALRRAALGIIRILIDRKIALPLKIVIDKALSNYPAKISKEIYPDKNNKELRDIKNKLTLEIIDFFAERLKAYLKDNCGIKADIVNEIFDANLEEIKKDKKCDLTKLEVKARFINNFVTNPANYEVINLYKRAANIVSIEEKKDKTRYDDKPSSRLLKNKYEKLLHQKIKQISPKIKKLMKQNKYDEAFYLLAELQHPISYFFDHVVVNVENDEGARTNRLLILASVRDLFNQIFNFSKIEI